MGRWLAVRIAAWGLRGGISTEEIMAAMVKAYPRQSGAWRLAVLEDAQARNQRKLASR